MNLPNFATICLLLAALTTFLLSLLISLSVPLGGTLGVLEPPLPHREDSTHNSMLSLNENLRWLVPTLLFLGATGFALLLAAAGLSIWHFVGRRRIRGIEEEASLQKDREEALQKLLNEHVGRLLGPADRQPEVDVTAMAFALQSLDPKRRYRFDAFRRESCHPQSPSWGTALPPVEDHTPPFRRKKILARILALGLALLGLFLVLWSILLVVFGDLIIAFQKEALGIELNKIDMVLNMIFWWILALNPLGLAVGFLGFSSIESRLQKAWNTGRDEARNLLLASYRRQLETLTSSPSMKFCDNTLVLLRSLTYIAVLELDASRKGTVLELLHRHGFLQKDSRALDVQPLGFGGASLSQVDLQNACLRDIDLQQADLTGADLLGADLRGARLAGADLRNSNLEGACLRNADLRGSRLHRANLLQAELSGAQLQGANLWQAKLRGVDLTHVQVEAAQLAAADR